MTTYARAFRTSPLAKGIGALLVALAFAVTLPGCKDDDKEKETPPVIIVPPVIPPHVLYRDAQGNLVPLDFADVQLGQFVFYAWLQDLPSGVLPAELASTIAGNPGFPLVTEQEETAPSFTQNLAIGWVGFADAHGVVHPVVGADVRWEIDQYWSGRINSTIFGTSDDNIVGSGYGVFDDWTYTRTNNGRLDDERFPLAAGGTPLYNGTGVGSPFIDGLTWVTLFSPDKVASARITAVATINGEEIGTKQILFKNFAPTPKIEITKTVDPALVNLPAGGTGTVTWTITVTNVGTGDATNVCLHDFLASGAAGNYVSDPPSPFDISCFDLPAPSVPPPPVAQLLGNAGSFAVLANGTVTNTGSSVVKGNVGVSAGSAITGFPPGLVVDGTIHTSDAVAQAAQVAVTAAMGDLKARPCKGAPDSQPLTTATPITPGVYCYAASASMAGPLVLDAQGDPAAVFVFNVGQALTVAAGSTMSLVNGASPCNVYWLLGSSGTIGAGAVFVGNILATSSVTAVTGASISGRALASTGSVTLDTNAVNAPLSCGAATPAPSTSNTLTFTATVDAAGTYCNEVQVVSFKGGTITFTPADLNAQACFTAVQPELSIVKDFVADDNTTSLGKARTVAASVPAKLRVRVFNGGSGPATAVQVNDALDGGALDAYQLISVSSGTPNADDGFDTAIGDLAAGASVTLFFTVSASADGTYCDTATVAATSGCSGALCSDSACLTVETPVLTITKADAPDVVAPGDTYTSTIVVHNAGNATARNVVIRDLLGINLGANVEAIYVSSSLNNVSGTLALRVVSSSTIDIPADGTVTFTVVSRIPLGAPACPTAVKCYCDTASVTSSNAATPPNVEACVNVPAVSALQTQIVDIGDPVRVGASVTYFSVLYVEALSNQGVSQNKLTYSFGLASPVDIGNAGLFQVTSTKIYLDSAPVRDAITGYVISDSSSPTAVLKTEGTDYTLATVLGKQVITMSPGVILAPNTALYVVHVAQVPTGTAPNRLYTTSYIWDSVGLVALVPYQASSSEPTTVIP